VGLLFWFIFAVLFVSQLKVREWKKRKRWGVAGGVAYQWSVLGMQGEVVC
jgi:hypothetical protein